MPIQNSQLEETRKGDWIDSSISDFTGGLNKIRPATLIDENEFSDVQNIVVRNGRPLLDHGYGVYATDPFSGTQQTVLGAPRSVFEHVDSLGGRTPIIVTDKTVYRQATDATNGTYLAGVSIGVSDTLAVAISSSTATITLVDGSSFSASGILNIVDDNSRNYTIGYTRSGNVFTLDVATPAALVAAIGSAVFECQSLSGVADRQVTGVLFPTNQWLIFTNGVDIPKKFDGLVVQDLGGLGAINLTTCNTMAVFATTLVLGAPTQNGTKVPNRVVWSDIGDPETWVPALTNNAGVEEISDSVHEILAMELLGDVNIIYLDRAIVRHEFVGTKAQLFNFRNALQGPQAGASGIGIISPKAVFSVGDFHLFVARTGIFQYKGGFNAEAISDKVFDGIFSFNGELKTSLAPRAFLQHFDGQDELYFFYPVEGDTFPTRSLILNLRTGHWSKRVWTTEFSGTGKILGISSPKINELIGTIAEQQWTFAGVSTAGVIPKIVLLDKSGLTYTYDYISGDDNGTPIQWQLTTREFFFQDLERLFDTYTMRISGQGVTIEYSVDNGVNWKALVSNKTLPVNPTILRLTEQVSSKTIMFRFSGSGGSFTIKGMSIRHRAGTTWGL